MKLYEATAALEHIREMLEESEGEWTPLIEDAFNAADGDFTEKVERVALFIRDRLARSKANAEQAEFHAKRASAFARTAENVKAYLFREMERAGKTKVEAPLVTVAIQLNSPSCVAPEWDEEALRGMAMYSPAFVKRVPETFTLNRRAILDAHKAGEPIPGGVTIVQTSSLRIR